MWAISMWLLIRKIVMWPSCANHRPSWTGHSFVKKQFMSTTYTVRTCLTSHLANIVLLHIWICLYTRCSLWATVLIEFCIRSVSHYKSQDLYRFWWKLNFPWDTHLKSELFTLKWVFIQNWTSVYTCSKVYTSDGATCMQLELVRSTQ